MNIYWNVQYSTFNRVKRVERCKHEYMNTYRMYNTVHSIGSQESKDEQINIYKNVHYSTLIGSKESKDEIHIFIDYCTYIIGW